MTARALLLDYGGVLTDPIGPSFARFEDEHGLPVGSSFDLLIGAAVDDDGGPIGAIERGEITVEEFEVTLRELLRDAGHDVPVGAPLLEGLFAGVEPSGGLWDVAARARAAGVRTALLSNSWGTDFYPFDRLERHFDELVISGQVGLRKPDPAIYLLASDRLGVAPERCAFVDDLPGNVEVARSLGMFGVHHHGGDDAVTAARLEAFLEVDLVRA